MRRRRQDSTPEIPIAPMIDCVFLMLVYFMTTSSLDKSEADLGCPAGQAGIIADPLPAVDEQRLEIMEEGTVFWNGSRFAMDDPGDRQSLLQRLILFRNTCLAAGSEPSLQIIPEPKARHQALVRLLDSITNSGIEAIHLP